MLPRKKTVPEIVRIRKSRELRHGVRSTRSWASRDRKLAATATSCQLDRPGKNPFSSYRGTDWLPSASISQPRSTQPDGEPDDLDQVGSHLDGHHPRRRWRP